VVRVESEILLNKMSRKEKEKETMMEDRNENNM